LLSETNTTQFIKIQIDNDKLRQIHDVTFTLTLFPTPRKGSRTYHLPFPRQILPWIVKCKSF